MNLGDIASVATLILFAFYFIGRAITIFRFRGVFPDEIRMEAADFEKAGNRLWKAIPWRKTLATPLC